MTTMTTETAIWMVDWQSESDLDSIRNSCDVYCWCKKKSRAILLSLSFKRQVLCYGRCHVLNLNIAKSTTDPRHWVLSHIQHLSSRAEASKSFEHNFLNWKRPPLWNFSENSSVSLGPPVPKDDEEVNTVLQRRWRSLSSIIIWWGAVKLELWLYI